MLIARFVVKMMLALVLLCAAGDIGTIWLGSKIFGMELAFSPGLHILDLNHNITIEFSTDGLLVYRFFEWSPDGQFIAYAAAPDFATLPHLYIVNMRGEIRQLTSTPVEGSNPQPRWSPDGRQIAITTLSDDGRGCDIVGIDVENGGQQVLIEDDRCGAFNWSPDGIHFRYDTQVWRVDTREVIYDTNGSLPRWSPDGNHIVFERHEQNENYIYVAQSNGQGERLLTNGQNAIWLPDGRIAFVRSTVVDSQFVESFWMMDIHGENIVELPSNQYGSWSPDMQWVAALVWDGIVDPDIPQYHSMFLHVLHVDSSTLIPITQAEESAYYGWRP